MLARLLNTVANTFYKAQWTHHLPKRKPDKPLQAPIKHWKVFKGDVVKVITGEDKGKVGKVVKVLRKLNRVVVKGVNIQ